MVKTDANGTLQWSKTYGGTDDELAYSMVITSDGGYAMAGMTYSSTTETSDLLLLKTYANGTLQWSQIYNSTYDEYGYSLAATLDGGYAIAGMTYSPITYSGDVYLLKTDANGAMQWNQTYGGTSNDYGYSLIATGDGGYAIGGYTQSLTTRSYDMLLVKASSNGTLEWSKTYGGTESERGRALVATSDGGYAIAGYAYSEATNSYDVIVVKTEIMIEVGLARISTGMNTLTLYRGADDPYWQYVKVQIWKAD